MVLDRVTSFSSVLTLHVYSPDISTPGSLHTARVSYTYVSRFAVSHLM